MNYARVIELRGDLLLWLAELLDGLSSRLDRCSNMLRTQAQQDHARSVRSEG